MLSYSFLVQPDGVAIRRRREELGYGLNRFADHIGISAPYLSRLERQTRTNPSPEILKRIAEGLGSQVTDIADHEERTHE